MLYIYVNYKSIKSLVMRFGSLLKDTADEELNILSHLNV